MTNVGQPNPEHAQRAEVEVYLGERLQWMSDAVEVVTGEREGNPLEVFPTPTNPRDASEGLPDLTEEQQASLREKAERFGIGAKDDVPGTASVRIKEGGKVWKIEAETKISDTDGAIIFAGWPRRVLGDDETDFMQTIHGVDMTGKNEYDAVRWLAEAQDGFVPLEKDEVMPFGYDIQNNFELTEEATGQLVTIGTKDGKPVMLLRIDHEDYQDEDGATKFRKRPDTTNMMVFISNVLSACGDETSGVGFDTSTTYASRVVDTIRAGLTSGRFFDVGMYGRQTLADVRQLPVAEPTGMNQIPGELHALYQKLQSLQAELDQQ